MSIIKRKSSEEVAAPAPITNAEHAPFVCVLGEACNHHAPSICRQYALEDAHRKACPMGEECDHFASSPNYAMRGIPEYARASAAQRTPSEMRGIKTEKK
jgi:hypothetical protein